MRERWDRWGWAVTLIALTIVFLVSFLDRSAFCGSETENCFREWISALSGWAAVAAAVPTIYYLSRQIRDAQNHHLQNQLAARAPATALCRSAGTLCDELDNLIIVFKQNLAEEGDAKRYYVLAFLYRGLTEIFERDTFRRFEIEIGPPRVLGAEFIRSLLKTRYDYLELAKDSRYQISSETFEALQSGDHGILLPSVADYVANVRRMVNEHYDATAKMVQTS